MTNTSYNFSFIGAYLRPELARIEAEAFLSIRKWDEVKKHIISNNSFQSRTRNSLIRMEGEIRQRLKRLTEKQISLMAKGSGDELRAMSWLSVIKNSLFIREFTAEILRGKLSDMDTELRLSDFSNFISSKTSMHPELESLKSSSLNKIRQILYGMLTEAGLILKDGKSLKVAKPVIPVHALDVILDDDPYLLDGFLWSEREIMEVKNKL
jgi:hypothetical protein